MGMRESILLSQAAIELGELRATLTKRCQRDSIPGAFKDADNNWRIPLDVFLKMKALKGDPYHQVYQEWIHRMEKGIGYKKPCSARSIEAYEYGMIKFWIFVYKPPTVIKTSFKKGEERPKPKMEPCIDWMTAKNLRLALSNVPINHKEEKCHFSLKEKMFNAFKSLYRIAIDMGYGTIDEYHKIAHIDFVRIYEEKAKALTYDEVLTLLKANETLLSGRFIGKQDFDIALTRIIMYLGFSVGLRRQEMINLKLDDVDLVNHELTVMGKGLKKRTIGFNEQVYTVVKAWLRQRPSTLYPNLLLTIDGLPVTKDIIYRRVMRIGKIAGIKVWPHVLRHTYASLAIEQGIEVCYVSESLGHTRLSTTEKTYVHINKMNAIASGKKFNPGVPILPPEVKKPNEKALKILEALNQI